MKRLSLLALTLLLFAPAAHAGGFYIGAAFMDAGVEIEEVNFDEDDSGFKALGGYRWKYFGLEGSYADFGEPGNNLFDLEISAISATAVGTLPLGKRFELFAKGGAYQWDVEVSGNDIRGEDDDVDFTYGAGAKLVLGRIAIRAEYEIFEIDSDDSGGDVDVEAVSLGLEFRFGK
jgi:opacity protein-like surface antigen